MRIPLLRPLAVAGLGAALVAACEAKKPEVSSETRTPSTAASPAAVSSLSPELRKPAPSRIVAIGDIHGDFEAMTRALKLAGAVDDALGWVGGDLVVVQTGDQLDRGDDDRKILDVLDRLSNEAAKAGGALHVLNGNHELMQPLFDFRYVTEGAFRAFDDMAPKGPAVASLEKMPEGQRGRAVAFAPGGVYAKMLAKRPFVLVLGDNVFVHGGILPKHVAYGLDKMHAEVKSWLEGAGQPPKAIMADDAPTWARTYSAAPGREECATLGDALGKLGAKRMVMGHTPQRGGITAACDDRAWRVDVGMSRYYQGTVEVLEIRGDAVKALKP